MTVANNYAPVVAAANGSATVFSGPWNAISAAYLMVQLLNTTTGVQTTVTQGSGASQYQVTTLTASGFTITFNTAPASGNNVIIQRKTPPQQTVPYTTSRGFQGSVEEGSFDTLTAMMQENNYNNGLAIQAPAGDAANLILPIAPLRVNKILSFDANGNAVLIAPATSPGADLSAYTIKPAGATATVTLAKRASNTVYGVDFTGVDATGATNSTAGLQAALATHRDVCLPPGNYVINLNALKLAYPGQRIYGENGQNATSLISAAGAAGDMIRVGAAYAGVENIYFIPSNTLDICLRVYAGYANIKHNRMIAHTNNSGNAILLTEIDPDTSATVPGAYVHTIEQNYIGYNGFAFSQAIDTFAPTNGINACKFFNNVMINDHGIKLNNGGGNVYIGNTFQSSTGTLGTPAGYPIDLGETVQDEKILANYFENYLYGILTRKLINDFCAFTSKANHFDNCTNQVYSLGTSFYIHDDDVNLTELRYGWKIDYSDGASLRIFDTAGNVVSQFKPGAALLGKNAALATNATAGFPWIPSCAGAPTGVLTAPYTGAIALVYDSTDNKLYANTGGTWKSVTLT